MLPASKSTISCKQNTHIRGNKRDDLEDEDGAALTPAAPPPPVPKKSASPNIPVPPPPPPPPRPPLPASCLPPPRSQGSKSSAGILPLTFQVPTNKPMSSTVCIACTRAYCCASHSSTTVVGVLHAPTGTASSSGPAAAERESLLLARDATENCWNSGSSPSDARLSVLERVLRPDAPLPIDAKLSVLARVPMPAAPALPPLLLRLACAPSSVPQSRSPDMFAPTDTVPGASRRARVHPARGPSSLPWKATPHVFCLAPGSSAGLAQCAEPSHSAPELEKLRRKSAVCSFTQHGNGRLVIPYAL